MNTKKRMKTQFVLFAVALLFFATFAFARPMSTPTAVSTVQTETGVAVKQFVSPSVQTEPAPIKTITAEPLSGITTETMLSTDVDVVATMPKSIKAFARRAHIDVQQLQTLYNSRRHMDVYKKDLGQGQSLAFGGKSSTGTMVLGVQYPGNTINYWEGRLYIQDRFAGVVDGLYQQLTPRTGAFLGYFKDTTTGQIKLAFGFYGVGPHGLNHWYLWEPESPNPATTVLHGGASFPFQG